MSYHNMGAHRKQKKAKRVNNLFVDGHWVIGAEKELGDGEKKFRKKARRRYLRQRGKRGPIV